MKKLLCVTVLLISTSFAPIGFASPYAAKFCDDPNYTCYTAEKGDSWENLFPDASERDLVKRLNRVNVPLRSGTTYAVPKQLGSVNKLDLAPFPQRIASSGRKLVVIDQNVLAWGAYSSDGILVNWGPASAGRGYCSDTGRACHTVTGIFTVYGKGTASCKSSIFPVGKGGAEMPYCMFFKGGYALHGSSTLPGYNASHGCVRLLKEDARWLNQDFIDLNHTQVIVHKLKEI